MEDILPADLAQDVVLGRGVRAAAVIDAVAGRNGISVHRGDVKGDGGGLRCDGGGWAGGDRLFIQKDDRVLAWHAGGAQHHLHRAAADEQVALRQAVRGGGNEVGAFLDRLLLAGGQGIALVVPVVDGDVGSLYGNVPKHKHHLALARVARGIHRDDMRGFVHQLVDSAVDTVELHGDLCLIALLAGHGGGIQNKACFGLVGDGHQGRLEHRRRRGGGRLGHAVYKLQACGRGGVLGDGHILGGILAGHQGVALLEVSWRRRHAVLALARGKDSVACHALSGFIHIADHHVHLPGDRGDQPIDEHKLLRAGAVRTNLNLPALRADQFVPGQQVDR